MGYIPAMFSKESVTFYVDGEPYSADASLPGYQELLDELKKADPDVQRLIILTQPIVAIREAIEEAVESVEESDYLPRGVVSVSRNAVLYNGEAIHGVLVDRILQQLEEGFNIMPMVRFLENLFQNPAEFARDELYLWLENSNLPITEDGSFLAYKRVNGNFTSIHDGRTKNDVGTVVAMPRENVDPVRAHECSTGLHFCSKQYLTNGPGHFGVGYSDANGSKIVLLKINPADVVSIPGDYGNTKGRAWKYEVLSVVGEDPATKVWPSVVSPNGDNVAQKDPDAAPFDPQSDIGKALFAAYNEIADDPSDRFRRLIWADDTLADHDVEVDLDSFSDLTVGQAKILLDVARAAKAADDQRALNKADQAKQVADQAQQASKQARIAAINSLGIIALRREASSAGLQGAWKGKTSAELRAFLLSKV